MKSWRSTGPRLSPSWRLTVEEFEPGTSQVAALIAGDEFSLYCFESLVSGRRLHITSARFDEPKGLALVEGAEIAICIHGRTDGDDPRSIWLGWFA